MSKRSKYGNRVPTTGESRPYRLLDRALVALAGSALAVLLNGDQASVQRELPPLPVTSIAPSMLEPTPDSGLSGSIKPPEALPSPELKVGNPRSFSWPALGIKDAGFEAVGEDNGAIAAPKGRSESGGYNTIGLWTDGFKPGEPGPSASTVHSTRHEESLVPREALTKRIEEIKQAGVGVDISIVDDVGTERVFRILPEDIYEVKDKARELPGLFEAIYDDLEQAERESLILITCAGNPNLVTGTSEDAFMFVAKLVKVNT